MFVNVILNTLPICWNGPLFVYRGVIETGLITYFKFHGKQCRPWSDIIFCGIQSWSTLFTNVRLWDDFTLSTLWAKVADVTLMCFCFVPPPPPPLLENRVGQFAWMLKHILRNIDIFKKSSAVIQRQQFNSLRYLYDVISCHANHQITKRCHIG